MTGDSHRELLARHIAAENAHDLESTLATLHEECVFRDHATGQVWHGRAGAGDHYRQWWKSFDVEVKRGEGQRSWWIDENTYVAQATWAGRHIGEFMGLAPTGETFSHPFTVFVGFRDALMAGEEFYYDLASLLAKLGADRIPEIGRLPYRQAA